MTFPLLLTSDGKKMGKTEKGAVWLDPEKTPPYEFYQYWRNIADADVTRCMKLLTFIPLEEIESINMTDAGQINAAKEQLAYAITEIVHGAPEAEKARQTARALFSAGSNSDDMPTAQIPASAFVGGKIGLLDLLVAAQLAPSKGEARRLVTQNGISINGEMAADPQTVYTRQEISGGEFVIKKGKKVFKRITAE